MAQHYFLLEHVEEIANIGRMSGSNNLNAVGKKTKAQIRKRFEELKDEWGGAIKIAKELRTAPGFEDFNRTTVYRWLDPKETIDPKKAASAIDFLENRKRTVRLKLAVPKTLQVLPVMIL